ncbi:hypothetical protein EU527_00545 [Candidatus Thorarchaeota archaeon]|nr:MAG: hypothetical protein EU527_00545 [Candidatus Thorarchaeota archaeon]
MTIHANNQDETRKNTSHEFIEIDGDLDIDFEMSDGENILIISKDQSYLTHGIHKFPAKFFPELPRYLIRRYSELGDTVLDPMCGSGTVVLEALLNNRKGIGIDIDLMARLITKVKTTPLDEEILQTSKEALLQKITEYTKSKKIDLEIPDFPYRDNWFRPYVLEELAVVSASIDETVSLYKGRTRVNLLDFYRVVMSSIIRDMSNADSHCTRTVLRKNVVKKIESGDTMAYFSQRLESQITNMKKFSNLYKKLKVKEVSLPDGTATETGLDDTSIDLAITSPPYINAVDYPRTHQLEMYWLGLLGTRPLSHVKRRYIGTETVYKDEYRELKLSGYGTLDPILEKIYEQDPRRSYITYKFFEDMKMQLKEMFRVLKPGCRYCIAIGNNLIRGVRVKSHEILSEIAVSQIGFDLEKQFFSKLIRHFIRIPRRERMQGEWILILKKPQ